MALWAKGMTSVNIQLQVLLSLHTRDCANHTGMLEMKTPALSKKVRGTSRLTICTLFLSFPSSPLLPREQEAPRRFCLPLQASWDLPRHYLILLEQLEPIPPLTTPGSVPAVTRFLWPFKDLIQNTFLAAAIFWLTAVGPDRAQSLFCSVQQRFYIERVFAVVVVTSPFLSFIFLVKHWNV